MSYRTIKRLLGETNFELKCLVLFGLGSTILAIGTFLLYWRQTLLLVENENKKTSRQLIAPIILEKHWKWAEAQPEFSTLIEKMAGALKPEELRDYQWHLFKANPASAAGSDRPIDDAGYTALEALQRGEPEFIYEDEEKEEFQYYGGIRASKSCLTCHYHRVRESAEGPSVELQEGDLLGVVRITHPLQRAKKPLHRTLAFVMTAEFIKVVLAILGIYLVVRYVITKPVLHLKKVSDAIAHGNLDMRADIRTGDEFEELSHAFNRMLRHLVTVQEELRQVNGDLDAKVDELAHVNLRLYELNNLKNEFLATMSHELRTPLNSILGFSDVLAGADNLSDKQTRYVTNIQTSGKSLMALINDVLDLAKIESGKMEIHAVEFSIKDLVERQSGAMVPMAEKKNIDLSWHVDPSLPLLYQDVGKLQQIINNLLSNAIKFTPEGGRVRVRAGSFEKSFFELVVEDTGIGIPLEDQETIFEKFRQGRHIPGQKDALTRRYEGTGLGLSIVKELTRLLGGEVTLQSEFGKGSTFTLRIPIRLDDGFVLADSHPQNVGSSRFRAYEGGLAGLIIAKGSTQPRSTDES